MGQCAPGGGGSEGVRDVPEGVVGTGQGSRKATAPINLEEGGREVGDAVVLGLDTTGKGRGGILVRVNRTRSGETLDAKLCSWGGGADADFSVGVNDKGGRSRQTVCRGGDDEKREVGRDRAGGGGLDRNEAPRRGGANRESARRRDIGGN